MRTPRIFCLVNKNLKGSTTLPRGILLRGKERIQVVLTKNLQCSIGYQLASVIAGGPAPLIATALLAATGSGYAIAVYILFCAVVSIIATALMPDLTNRDISQEHA